MATSWQRRKAVIARKYLLLLSDEAFESLLTDVKLTRLTLSVYRPAIVKQFQKSEVLFKLIAGTR